MSAASPARQVRWWQTWWVVVPTLVLCLPVGLIGLWLRPGLSIKTRGWLTAVVVAVLALAIALPDADPEAGPAAASIARPESEPQTTSTPTEPATPSEAVVPAVVMVEVPDLSGQTLDEAERQLRDQGLQLGQIERRPSPLPAGTVLGQGTRVGKELAEGSLVALVVAVPFPKVPQVVGSARGVAVRTLEDAGFRVVVTTRTVTSGKDNVVLSQSPGGGSRIKPHSTVRLSVSHRVTGLSSGSSTTGSDCTPGYRPCLAPASDYDCAGGSGDGPMYATGPIYVTGSDPYELDYDGDGVACES